MTIYSQLNVDPESIVKSECDMELTCCAGLLSSIARDIEGFGAFRKRSCSRTTGCCKKKSITHEMAALHSVVCALFSVKLGYELRSDANFESLPQLHQTSHDQHVKAGNCRALSRCDKRSWSPLQSSVLDSPLRCYLQPSVLQSLIPVGPPLFARY